MTAHFPLYPTFRRTCVTACVGIQAFLSSRNSAAIADHYVSQRVSSWPRPHILVATLDLWVAAWLVGKSTAAATGYPGLWDSLETPGEVAKLAPRGERLTGDAGSKVHHDDARELGLKASVRMGLGSTPPRCMSRFKACTLKHIETKEERDNGITRKRRYTI